MDDAEEVISSIPATPAVHPKLRPDPERVQRWRDDMDHLKNKIMELVTMRLVGGEFDGLRVEVSVDGGPIWVYRNIYNFPTACRPGDHPRTPAMRDYRVLPGADMAEFLRPD